MKRLSNRRLGSRGEAEGSVNPLDGVANLADVMLILAVGIMLALVINWNVDIGTLAYDTKQAQDSSVDTENALVFESDDMEKLESETEQADGSGMEKLGTVYFDETTGKYYIINEAEKADEEE